MSGKTVVVNFVKTESYKILFDADDVANSYNSTDSDLIEELCWDAVARNKGMLIASSSHHTFDVVDNTKLPNSCEIMKNEIVKKKLKRTERGWAGHFCLAEGCLFRRNTLLEYGDVRIVVSTVGGLLKDQTALQNHERRFDTLARGRYYETLAFYAERVEDRYWDADVSKEIEFESPWSISEIDADDKANDMHEKVVEELSKKLKQGLI